MALIERVLWLVCSLLVLGPAASWAQPRASSAVALRRDARDPHWVHARVDVAAQPEAVWQKLAQVDHWRSLFRDVTRLRVLRHAGRQWRIELGSRAMQCGPHDYVIRLDDRNRELHLVIDASGIDARGRMTVEAGVSPDTARVSYHLRVEATGVASWFVSEERLRGVQEQLVRSYLRDLRGAFAGAPGS